MSSLHVETPLLHSQILERVLRRPVYLKMENTQPTGSFKIRGIGLLCQEAILSAKAKGLVSATGPNAALAVAYSGRQLKTPTTLFIPETMPEWILRRLEIEGARIMMGGKTWEESLRKARDFAEMNRAFLVPSFDHPTIWAGHASLVLELSSQLAVPPALVVLAVGGGGLLCGVLDGMNQVGWGKVPVLTVESKGTASFAASLKAKKLKTLTTLSGIATGLAEKTVATEALAWTLKHPVHSWVATDKEIARATLRFADEHKVLLEAAGAAPLAAIYEKALPPLEDGPIVVIVGGGLVMNSEILTLWHKKFR